MLFLIYINKFYSSVFKYSSDDTESTEADFPVLHRLYGNYTAAGRNVSRLLDAVFKNYDKRIRPFYAGKHLTVLIFFTGHRC